MHNVLAIDQGNSSAKVAVVGVSGVIWERRFDALSIEALCDVMSDYQVVGAIYCSVTGYDARLAESLRHAAGIPVILLTENTPGPLSIDYSTPVTLGADRIACATGAMSLFQGEPLLVVDAGTAVTMDVLSADGVFVGGIISPGLSMRFRALHEYSSQLPLVSPLVGAVPFGNSTDECIRAGAQCGLAGEIYQTFCRAKEQFGVTRLVMTGGDASLLITMLDDIPITEIPSLVAIGLKRIYDYNEIYN